MATVATTCAVPLRKGKGKGKGKCDDDTSSDNTSDDASETASTVSTGEEVGTMPAHTRRLRQSDSDWEAYDDSDTDSYMD